MRVEYMGNTMVASDTHMVFSYNNTTPQKSKKILYPTLLGNRTLLIF